MTPKNFWKFSPMVYSMTSLQPWLWTFNMKFERCMTTGHTPPVNAAWNSWVQILIMVHCDCSIFLPLYKVSCSHRNMFIGNKEFEYSPPVSLQCVSNKNVYEMYYVRMSHFKNYCLSSFPEFCLGITIELPRASGVPLNICLLSYTTHYSKWHSRHWQL